MMTQYFLEKEGILTIYSFIVNVDNIDNLFNYLAQPDTQHKFLSPISFI